MSVCITEEERWQGMLCVAWPRRVLWPLNSRLATAQGQEGLDMDRGAGMLWEHCVLHPALPSSLDSGNGTGTPSSSAHLRGKACLDQTCGTPRCLPGKRGVSSEKPHLGVLHHSKFWDFWWHSLQGRGWHICVQSQQLPFGLMTDRNCHRPVLGFHWVEETYLQAGYRSGFG